jgi:hypothetical protein
MVVTRVKPMSAAKVQGLIGLGIGLLIGIPVSTFGLVMGSLMPSDQGGGLAGLLFGAGAIIVLPLFYGCVSFISGAIMAVIYNLAAGWVGGIEVETR